MAIVIYCSVLVCIAFTTMGSLLVSSNDNLKFKKAYAFLIGAKVIELKSFADEKFYTIKRKSGPVYWSDWRFMSYVNVFLIFNQPAGINELNLMPDGTVKDNWITNWKYV